MHQSRSKTFPECRSIAKWGRKTSKVNQNTITEKQNSLIVCADLCVINTTFFACRNFRSLTFSVFRASRQKVTTRLPIFRDHKFSLSVTLWYAFDTKTPSYPRSGATWFQVPCFAAQFFFTQWTHYKCPVRAVTDLKPVKHVLKFINDLWTER